MWVRIARKRRRRALGLLSLAAAAACGGAVVARFRASPRPVPARIATALDGSPRPDGSAALPAVWRLRFQGAELRVYRNALGVVHRCPGSPGCRSAVRGGTLDLTVNAAGEYRALTFSRPFPGDGGTLHGDLAAASERGDEVVMSSPLVAY